MSVIGRSRRPGRAALATAALAAAAGLAATPCSAQVAPPEMQPAAHVAVGPVVRPVGANVRVYAPRVLEGTPRSSPWFYGRLLAADSAGITLRTTSDSVVTIPRSFAAAFAARAGPAHRGRSIVGGALVGAALGAIVGRQLPPPGEGNTAGARSDLRGGVALGALAGALFAAVNPWDRWETAPLPTATRDAGAR